MLPKIREDARWRGLVTLDQITNALTFAIENPAEGIPIVTVPSYARRRCEKAR
jgi:hypothetical protein